MAGQQPQRSVFGVPLVVALFFVGMLLPTALSVNLGGLRLSAYRVVLILCFLPMLVRLLLGRSGQMNIFDAMIGLHCAWVVAALIKWGGLAQGIESGGIYVIECAGAYLVGRLYIRSCEDFVAMARAYVALVVGMLIFTIPEAITAVHILHDGASSVLGGPAAPYIDKRMGLERAFGPFDHPILYGVFSAAAFSMAYFVVAERRFSNYRGIAMVAGVSLATFLSGSGGPYLVLLMQGFVATWERVFSQFQGRWTVLFTLFGMAYLAIDLLSTKTPFHVFVNNFTFSKISAYNRIRIFDYGTAEVARHPAFGIGLGDWERPSWMSDSMDNFWLVITVRYGVPAFVLLLAVLIGLVVAAGRRKGLPDDWRRARHAWAFTLFGISVAAANTHLWNQLFVLFLFLLGAGAWLSDVRPGAAASKAEPRRSPVPRTRAPARLF